MDIEKAIRCLCEAGFTVTITAPAVIATTTRVAPEAPKATPKAPKATPKAPKAPEAPKAKGPIFAGKLSL